MDRGHRWIIASVLCIWSLCGPALCKGASQFRPVGEISELFVWTDVCNVYVLRDGKSAVLVDLGDGSVLDHLSRSASSRSTGCC